MSMSIFWEPVKEGLAVKCSYISSDFKALAETFGGNPNMPSMPVELGERHVFALQAMTKASGREIYDALADLIEKHGTIRVWGEY